jgi:large conductance mechanosensitive channel
MSQREEESMFKEFKAFIMKGNLIEIAVAFIMGLAFAAVVASFVADIITPIIGAVFGQPDFSALKLDIGKGAITYGKFLNVLLTFVVVAFVMFMIVKAYNRVAPKVASTKDCPFCLTAVPLEASRCAACTSQLEGASPSR